MYELKLPIGPEQVTVFAFGPGERSWTRECLSQLAERSRRHLDERELRYADVPRGRCVCISAMGCPPLVFASGIRKDWTSRFVVAPMQLDILGSERGVQFIGSIAKELADWGVLMNDIILTLVRPEMPSLHERRDIDDWFVDLACQAGVRNVWTHGGDVVGSTSIATRRDGKRLHKGAVFVERHVYS